MATIDLNLMRSFSAVHETGSFSRAALRLGVPRSTVSRAVATLEGALNVRLFQRTTRKVATTTAGLALFERVAPLLGSLDAVFDEVPEQQTVPQGTLRITTTADLGAAVLAEVIARYTSRYPQASVELHLSSAIVDLVREGFDLALRVAPGRLRGASLVVQKVGAITFRLYASPAYLARRGAPRAAHELGGHDWVAFRGSPPLHVVARKGKRASQPRTRVMTDDMFVARELVRAGVGVAILPSFVADPYLESGALVQLLPRWLLTTGKVFLVQPSGKHSPAKVTAFRDLLLETLQKRPL